MTSMFFKATLLILTCWCLQSRGYPFYQQTKGWTNKQAEIYFLLDSSSSVYRLDHTKQLKFVSDLVADMDIGPFATRVGVGLFSEEHYLYIGINNTRTKASLQETIMKAPRLTGLTYFSRALKGMREKGLPASITRPGVPLITVLLTDGDNNMSSHQQLIADNATLAKREGIFIFTVSIGHMVNQDKVRAIASDPKADFFFSVPDYDRLTDLRAELSRKMSEVDVLQGHKGMCGKKNILMDTVFVFDEAGLGVTDTQKVRAFLTFLVENIGMNSGNVRVGVISKTCQRKDVMLGEFVTREDFIAGLKDDKEVPKISVLLKKAWLDAFKPENGARVDAKRRIVMIMHAPIPEEKQKDILIDVSKAKFYPDHPIEVFVIRMGEGFERDAAFINSLATDSNKAFFIESPDRLMRMNNDFLNSFCQDL